MSSEAGYEPDVDDSPLRVSGFISLILSLLSGFAIVTLPMLAVAVAAILVGIFALRKSDSRSLPVGTTAAKIGICLAVLFGAWGAAKYSFRYQTLGSQAEYFARQFVRVASSGNEVYTRELQKSYVNRFLKTMPLEESYERARQEMQERRERSKEELGGAPEALGEEEDTTVADLSKYPADQEWVLFRPVRIYHHYGRQMAEVVLATDTSESAYKVRLILEHLIHRERGSLEWYVESCLPYRERIVAESIL